MKKLIAIVCSLLVCAGPVEADVSSVGSVFSMQGSALVRRKGADLPAKEGMNLEAGDEVVVDDPGRIALALSDGSYIRLAASSRLTLSAADKKVGLLEGALHFFSHSEQHPTVVTEHVTAAIRGTEFTLTTDRGSTTIAMMSGSVQGMSEGGLADLSGGQGARFAKGRSPQVYALLQSDRTVQWSAFVPLFTEGDISSADVSVEGRAMRLVAEGKNRDALNLLPTHERRCSMAGVVRARILISQGDTTQGVGSLERCVNEGTDAKIIAAAASTLSAVKLAQGAGDEARSLASKAITADPGSVSARLALSFALQDKGDLDGALAAVTDTTVVNEDLIARRAEVLFMFGRVPEARAILETLRNRSWYAETVYGFVLMGDRSFDEAEGAFTRATEMEPGAGLPQMGLGLVEVNRGNLVEGRSRFERATVLEPSRSLYRSYLAKSYFEADTYDPAEPEYARAIELDPNDPTPHLYRSFMRLAENKPVEALRDIEAARDLSDKRDVYRSKFLLDEDSATQSASLSRVYRELGFEQRGRIEAVSAIYDDYQNASAHRLLSETDMAVLTAPSALSERRIADLFSPLSINVADSIGTNVSLNEYSSLFERDGWRTGITGNYSSYDDQFVEGILSANKSGNVLTALTASGVHGDGAIDDPRSNEGRAGISVQAQPTWGDRFLGELRGVFYDSDQTEENNTFASGTFNGSYLHKFSPETSFIAQTSYRRGKDRLTRPEDNSDIHFTSPDGSLDEFAAARYDQKQSQYESAAENELQVIDTTGIVTSVLTGRYSNYDLDAYDHSLLLNDDLEILDDLGVEFDSAAQGDVVTSGVDYLATVRATDSLSLNVGADYSHVGFSARQESPFVEDDQYNEKLTPQGGIVYRPSSAFMARVGYGQNLGRSSFSSLASVEPTLIGGISQRYQDNNPGVIAENFGTGIDVQPWRSTYIGGEWVRRWLDEPRVPAIYAADIDFENATVTTDVEYADREGVDIQQDFVSAYVYQIVTDKFVLGNDYRYARNTVGFPDDSFVKTQRNRAFGRYFFTSMFFAQSGATYLYQDRTGYEFEGVPNGSDAGWLFDAALGYRLPTRHGFITAGVNNIFGQNFVLEQAVFNDNAIIINDPIFELAARINF
jgi:tetratricopeptide (TPR) repeat protein